MASGSTLTISGGIDMTLVVAGTDIVDDLDYNNANDNVDLLLGTPPDTAIGSGPGTTTYGLNQGGTPEANASIGNTIIATHATNPGAFKDLQDQVQQLQVFLNPPSPTTVTDVAVGDTITASDWNAVMNAVKELWDNRYGADNAGASTDDTQSYIVGTTGAFDNSISNEITYTFSSEAAARAYFNGNGKIGITASRSGGTSPSDINDAWDATFAAIGDVQMGYTDVTAGSGTSYGIGFYDLTTSYQKIFDKFSGGTYSGDYIQVDAKINDVNNPTVVTLQVTLVDGPDGPTDNSPDGTFTINARTNFPDVTGTTFSFAGTFSSVVAGAISGT